MIDVDHFKSINDNYGHIIGDHALIDVSQILKRSGRIQDFIGRFGGDEFIIIGHAQDNSEIDSIYNNINNNLKGYNAVQISPYTLNLKLHKSQKKRFANKWRGSFLSPSAF